MFGEKVPDKTLLKNVTRKMAQKCPSSNKVSAMVSGGEVTLTGTIKHEHERKPILRCAEAVTGVSRVTDQMNVEVKKSNFD